MKVDPKGIVSHLRRAVRQDDRRTEDYLAGVIVEWIQRTDELDAEVKALREALEAQQDAEPLEGEPWEITAEDRDALLAANQRRLEPGQPHPMEVFRDRLRARVQPRRVSEVEVRDMAEDLAQHGYTWTGDIIRHVLTRLGIEITPEEEESDA